MAETKQTHSLRKRVLACLMSVVLVAGIIAPGTLTAFAETPAKTGTTEPVATEDANAPDTKADPSPANTAVADNNEADEEDEALENDEPDNQTAKDAAAAAGAAGAATSMSAQDEPGDKAYATFDDAKGELTFKYGAEMPEGAWDVSNTGETQLWSSKATSIKKVVFDASFKNAAPLSTYAWFKGCKELETITDLKNLNTSNTTNMAEMFSGCKALKELDLSAANTKNVGDMKDAFKDCSKLEKVTLGENFSFKTVKLGEDGKPVVGDDDKPVAGEESTWGKLPTPPTAAPNTGKWWKDGKAPSKTPEEMQAMSGSELKGEWTWETEKPTEYKITATPDPAEGGTVTTDPADKSEANKTVKVTATPKDGYEIVKITYKGKDSEEVDITTAKQFNMPEKDTTVKATFKKIKPGEIKIGSDSSAWQKAKITSSVEDVKKAVENKLTDEEKNQLNAGDDAIVLVKASKASDVSSDLQQKLKKAPGDGYYVGALVDINLYVKMGEDERQIYDLDSTIDVTLNMPSSLMKEGKEYEYAVAYEHDGDVKTAKSSFDKNAKKLTITSKEFSTYAIDYKSKTASTGDGTTKSSTSPKTGDPLNIIPIVAIVVVALGVVIFAGVRTSRSRSKNK